MNDVKEKLTQIGTHILVNARNELYLAMRFLDIALNSLEYEFNLKTFFTGTDGVNIYYNPRFLMERYEISSLLVNRAYLHMVLHCIFHHMYGVEEKEEEEWNLACDIATEYLIDSLDYKAVRRVTSDYRIEVYEKLKNRLTVLTAEGIYKVLLEEKMPYHEFVRLSTEFLTDDHIFWSMKRKDQSKEQQEEEQAKEKDHTKEEKQHQEEKQEMEEKQRQMEKWKKASESMKTNLETYSASIGNEAGDLLKALRIETRKRYDYRSFLRKFAVTREEMQVDEDSFDYGYYNFGIQAYGNMPLMEALEYKEVKKIEEFVIAIDTSGSCSGELVLKFLEQTYAILRSKESFFKKVRLHILQCDMEVKEDVVIQTLEEFEHYKENFELKGFGGTDFRPVFEYVDELIQRKELKHLKGLIYFTDGFGKYPKKRPDYEVAFVFLKNDYTDAEVPAWAIKLIQSEDEIRENEHKTSER